MNTVSNNVLLHAGMQKNCGNDAVPPPWRRRLVNGTSFGAQGMDREEFGLEDSSFDDGGFAGQAAASLYEIFGDDALTAARMLADAPELPDGAAFYGQVIEVLGQNGTMPGIARAA